MTAPSFNFAGLTPDLILDALEQVEIYPETGLLALNSYENRVYQFATDEQRWVAKFYRPARWSDAQILEEHAFTEELAAADIPVVVPRRLPLANADAQTLHHFQGSRFAVFDSVGGRALESDQDDHLFELGRQIGRLHMVGRSQSFTHRPQLFVASMVDEVEQALRQCPLIPGAMQVPFFTIFTHIAERLRGLDLSGYQSLRLHGDCHVGNILWRDDRLWLVDFDDCRQGPAIQDLWMMLSGDRSTQLRQLDSLLDGYEEFASFDHAELSLIEPLRAWRIIHYMAWLAKRWDDPAFVRSFSWFAEESYWEQQVLVLKEQLAALDEEPLRLQSGW